MERYVEAAARVCEEGRRVGMHSSVVLLHGEAGPPVLAVDDIPGVTDQHRLTMGVGEAGWRINPIFGELRARLGPIGAERVPAETLMLLARQHGYTGASVHSFATPVLGPAGWFGTIMFGSVVPIVVEQERGLSMLATQLSVWCTERGIGRVPRIACEALPARRFRIAQLAADGRANAEIADVLGISINTVKSRLKQAFAQLGVDNRTELVTVLRRLAPLDGVKPGVTHVGSIAITRAP